MKAVVDTNVIAYAILGTPGFAEEAMAFLASTSELKAPASWEAELVNVVWMAVRKQAIHPDEAVVALGLAARLGIASVDVRSLWHGALLRSIHSGIAVYDSLFVELAERERVPLVTFDRRLASAFPSVVRTLNA